MQDTCLRTEPSFPENKSFGLLDTLQIVPIELLRDWLRNYMPTRFLSLSLSAPFRLSSSTLTMQSWHSELEDGSKSVLPIGDEMAGGSAENTTSYQIFWWTSRRAQYDLSMKPRREQGFILDGHTPDFGRRIANTDSHGISGNGGQQSVMTVYVRIARL